MKNTRRDFIKQFGSATTFVAISGIPSLSYAEYETNKLTVLHTNDVHSHIDPFPDNDPLFPGLGGAARRAYLINKI